jgi:hypothetical protein
MEMSLMPMGSIKEYWLMKHFSGHLSKSTGCLIKHLNGHGDFRDNPPGVLDEDTKEKDPLYHSQVIFNHFQKQCVCVAVPLGMTALHEASMHTTA